MMPGADKQGSLTIAVVRTAMPPDDSGAETADRYEWQAMMATADVLAAYLMQLNNTGHPFAASSYKIICELHEDWAVLAGESAELVSAKHRETSVPPLGTIRSFLDCGVTHLFNRWVALDELPTCRLVTTAGLTGDTSRLVALSRNHDDAVDEWTALLTSFTKLLPCSDKQDRPTVETAASFLSVLTIQHSEPHRKHLPDIAPTRFAAPIADQLNRPGTAEAIWGATLALVRQRMRAAGPTGFGGLPAVLGKSLSDDLHAPRTVTLTDVDTAIRFAVSNAQGYVRLPRRPRLTKLAVKMSHGGCSDNAIERLEYLRLQHQQYWRGLHATPALRDPRRQLQSVILSAAAEATDVVETVEADWGMPLLNEAEARLQIIADGPDAQGLDIHLLLGGLAELTNNCRVWFSHRFNVEEAIAQLRAAS